MLLLAAVTASLAFWIVAWSLGAKGFDAFLVVIGVAIVGFTLRLVTPFVKQQLGRE